MLLFQKKSILKILFGGGLLIVLAACQVAAPKAELDSLTAAEAIHEVSKIMEEAKETQADLLAWQEYSNGVDKLEDAKNTKKSIVEQLDSAAVAKGYFLKSIEVAKSHNEFSPPILEARKSALKAGLQKSRYLVRDLEKIDEQLRDQSNDFNRTLDLDDFTYIQKSYLTLETKAIVYSQLSQVKGIIARAERENAKRRAPQTLAQAKMDVAAAQNLIMQNALNSQRFSPEVQKAKQSTLLLAEVMEKIKDLGFEATEQMALSMLINDRKMNQITKR